MSERDLLRDTTRRFLTTEFPLERVRELADGDAIFARDVWQKGAELGWTAMLVPEGLGGGSITGEPIVDLAIVAEEMGRLVQPWPWMPSNIVAFALAEHGSALQQHALAPIASGEAIATWALTDADRPWNVAEFALTVERQGSQCTLTGAKTCVQDADVADWFLVAAGETTGPTQFLVPAASAGITIEPLQGLDFTRRQFRVEFASVEVPAGAQVGETGQAAEAIDRQLQLAFVLQCAESVGGAERLCELTFQYAKDRFAFGRPIGSFQAVKHMCADMAVLLEGSKAATAAAAKAVQERSTDAPLQASIASAHVGQAFSKIARDAIQIHGGIGYTWEHDAHLFLRRAKANEILYGEPSWHRERLCQLVGVSEQHDG